MKYNDNGEYKEVVVKSVDTLPVGTEVDFDGNEVPSGWTAVDNILWENSNTAQVMETTEVTLSENINNFSYYSIIFRVDTSQNNYINTGLLPVTAGTMAYAIQDNVIVKRQCEVTDNGNKMKFYTAMRITTYGTGSSQSNNNMTPYKIIGHR